MHRYHNKSSQPPNHSHRPIIVVKTQYDVELVHAIEGLVGTTLAPYEMDEGEVLKGITRVYAAKRRAALEAAELERREGGGAGGGGGGGGRRGAKKAAAAAR